MTTTTKAMTILTKDPNIIGARDVDNDDDDDAEDWRSMMMSFQVKRMEHDTRRGRWNSQKSRRRRRKSNTRSLCKRKRRATKKGKVFFSPLAVAGNQPARTELDFCFSMSLRVCSVCVCVLESLKFQSYSVK